MLAYYNYKLVSLQTNKPVVVGGELAQIIQSSRFHSAFKMQSLKQNVQIVSLYLFIIFVTE